ncbi:MAG: DHA2 family efflux MFS transporter permease subunit [Solirubrobacterales bacterium]|nr:DHA2 family efflux MFS transporter permease subunit [Solirubrobacterales bacterium]
MLSVCSLSLLIVSLDATIMNVALPSIHRALPSSIGGLQWVIDAYTLVIASVLMLSASTGDRVGRRRMFQIGLVIFLVASLICGLAPNLGVLIGARALQAVGGSMLNPMALSVIRNVFVDPRERAMAVGVWGAVPGISMSLGPIVGGTLVAAISWRAVFFINVPIGLIALVLARVVMPESRAPAPRRPDPIGQILMVAALASLTYGIIGGPSAGWTSAQTLSLGAVSLLAWIMLIHYELGRRQPLLEVRAFASAPLSGASASAIATYASFGGFLFLNTLYLQDVRHLSALAAGVRLLPMALATFVGAPLSGRVVGARGARLPLLCGGAALAVAGIMLTRLSAHTPYIYLAISYVLLGGGVGVLNPPITNTAVSGMPPTMAGVAAAVTSTSRQTGQTVGVAVLGALAGGGLAAVGPGFAHATHVAWWIVGGLGTVIFVLGGLTTTAWAQGTAQRAAARFGSADS